MEPKQEEQPKEYLTPKELFEKRFEKFRHQPFKSSLEHYLETGKLSGSFMQQVRDFAYEFVDLEAEQEKKEKLVEPKENQMLLFEEINAQFLTGRKKNISLRETIERLKSRFLITRK